MGSVVDRYFMFVIHDAAEKWQPRWHCGWSAAATRGGRTGPTDRQRPMLKDLGVSEAEINNIKTSGEASTMIE